MALYKLCKKWYSYHRRCPAQFACGEEDIMHEGTVAARSRDLRQMLVDRRREIEEDVRERIRQARTQRPEPLGDGDHSDMAMQTGIDFAVIQLKTETLARIDAALVR